MGALAAAEPCGSDDDRAAVVRPADPDDMRATDPRSSSISSSETLRACAKNSLASRSHMFLMWYMFPKQERQRILWDMVNLAIPRGTKNMPPVDSMKLVLCTVRLTAPSMT